MQRISPRFNETEVDALHALADRAGGNPTAVVARIVRSFLATGLADLPPVWPAHAAAATPTAAPRSSSVGPELAEPGVRPSWLPPEGDKELQRWLGTRGPSVEALFARYPVELRARADDWPQDPIVAEAIFAISVWRDEIDAGLHPDARIELAFRAALQDTRKLLEGRTRDLAVLREKDVPERTGPRA